MKTKQIFLLVITLQALWCMSCTKENTGNSTAINKIDTLTVTPSLKGWELYSWPDGNNWRFSLMVGTNRLKTLDEVTSLESSAVHLITVTGTDTLKAVLLRFPENESILWIGQTWLEHSWGANYGTLQLPGDATVEDISAFCSQHKLVLTVIK